MTTRDSTVNPDIFKAYDVRGVYGEDLTEEAVYRIGRATALYLNVPEIAVCRDMRVSSPQLTAAAIQGITDQGVNVIDCGMTTTDELYFIVGYYNYPAGIMITASHNPKQYNGIKFCRAQAYPISLDTGLADIRDLAIRGNFPEPAHKGSVTHRDATDAYIKHALSYIDVSKVRPLKVVVDAGNGMAGMIMPRVFEHLPAHLYPLYFELDGTFPNHSPSPIEPENLVALQEKVLEVGADFGAAFDGDADRMFPVDDYGNIVDGSMVMLLLSDSILRKHPGSTILYNLVLSKSVPALIERKGGKAIRTRVGHSYIKAEMRKYNAILGGEHSGHFYFRDNWYADSGLIAFLLILELISIENKPLSELIKPLDTWVRSGEINTHVNDVQGKTNAIEEHFGKGALSVDHLDGVTFDYGDWWFNVRPSNTEPLLRLNLEAKTRHLMEQKRDEVLEFIRS